MEKNNMKKNKQFHLVQTLEFHGFYILFFSQCLTNHVHILVVQSICSEFKETAASVIYIYISYDTQYNLTCTHYNSNNINDII